MSNPLVSVCIPVYNNANTVVETIESVFAQTYRNIELIIVEDASSDDSDSKIREVLSTNNSGIEVVFEHNDKNLGMAGNWNKCLNFCKGKYVKLLCADDKIAPSLIEREVEILEKYPNVVSVESDTAFVDVEGNIRGHYNRYRKSGVVSGKEVANKSLFYRDYFGAPLANTFRRDVATKCGGFNPEFNYIIDYEFLLKIGLDGDVYIIHEPLNFFCLRGNSNTASVFKGEEGRRYINEHRMLVQSVADKLGYSKFQVELSVLIRRIMSYLGQWYLRLHMLGAKK